MKRKIDKIAATCKAIKMDGFADEPARWLFQQMRTHNLNYLLAHADDGVIWGRLDGEELITSHDVAPENSPPLRIATLQTARIFGRTGELLVWHNEAGAWTGRLIAEAAQDSPPEWTEAFDERQVLWGTNAEPRPRGFAVMREGSQGLVHVVPLPLSGKIDEQKRPVRLVVRHYVKADDHGFVRIDASRLVSLLQEL